MKKLILAFLFSLLLTVSAFAESLVVQTCGTNPQAYPAGATRLDTVDVNGNKCGNATVSGTVNVASGYPSGATPVTNTNTLAGAGSITATLPGVVGKTTYICGFTISANATAATFGLAFVGGTIAGNLGYQQPIAAAPAVGTLPQTFSPCIPASAANTSITVNSQAPGTGGNQSISVWGYQQ